MTEESRAWRKSSFSSQDTNCVEVAVDARHARVRDTKARQQGHIEVSPQAWQALLERL